MRYGDLARLQAVLGGKLFVWKTELALHDIDEKGSVRSGEEGAPKEHVVNDEMSDVGGQQLCCDMGYKLACFGPFLSGACSDEEEERKMNSSSDEELVLDCNFGEVRARLVEEANSAVAKRSGR